MMEKLTDSLSSFLKSIGSWLKDLDILERWNALSRSMDEVIHSPVLVAVAGLALLLAFLLVLQTFKKTSDTRQRLDHLNKALSKESSYGLSSLVTQLGEEPPSTDYNESSDNHTPPSLDPARAMEWSPPADKEIDFPGWAEAGNAENKKIESGFSLASSVPSHVMEEEGTITFHEEPNPVEEPETIIQEKPNIPAAFPKVATELSLEESLIFAEPSPSDTKIDLPDTIAEVDEKEEEGTVGFHEEPNPVEEPETIIQEKPNVPAASPESATEPSLEKSLTFAEPSPTAAEIEPPEAIAEVDEEINRESRTTEIASADPLESGADNSGPGNEAVEPAETNEPLAVESSPEAAQKPLKKAVPFELTLDQLIEEPKEEIPDKTPPNLEPAPLESTPIPEEKLEDIEVAVNEKKSDSDATPVEKVNAPMEKEKSELPPEAPTLPEETETIPLTQKTGSEKTQRLITRLETFQQNAEKIFASKGPPPKENEKPLPASISSENLSLNSPASKDGNAPTPTLEELETFLFTARQKK